MVTTFCLITCVLATSQQGGGPEWSLLPQLSRGQELVYRGSFAEESIGQGVQFSRSFRLENRVLVFDVFGRGADVAFFTVLRVRTDAPAQGKGQEPSSVRLEIVQVNPQGRLEPAPGTSVTIPLDGPPTLETGAFVEVPKNRIGLNRAWETTEPGRPPRSWQIVGIEPVNGTSCLKLEGRQQSEDWDRPRADHTAWRRVETAWLAPRLGLAYRIERTIERREPARRDATHRSVTRYELESTLVYPEELLKDRRREITQARNFAEAAEPYLRDPAKYGPAHFDAILTKIAYHLDNQPPTPYREAMVQFRHRVEAARRGEALPAPPPSSDETVTGSATAAVGQPAPDFVATDLGSRDTMRLRRALGRPVVLLFYSPNSRNAEDVLRFGQSLADLPKPGVTVVGLAVTDEKETVVRQRNELHLTYPLLSGRGLRSLYAVEATPKLMVLDAEGIVRGAFDGWGRETPGLVTDELKHWQSGGRGR